MYLYKKKTENHYLTNCNTICKYTFKNYLKKKKQLSLELPSHIFANINNKLKVSSSTFWNLLLYYYMFSKIPFIGCSEAKNNTQKKTDFKLDINIKNMLKLNIINNLRIKTLKKFFFTVELSIIIKHIFNIFFNANKKIKIAIKINS